MTALQKDYVRVWQKGRLSYGGSQMCASKETIRVCGCGPVAVLDLLLYMTGRQEQPIPLEEYNRELEALCRSYFPLIKPLGINGVLLAVGTNRLLRKNKLPFFAFWAVSGKKYWMRVEELLGQDLPVVFSVGPNFPAIWKKERLTFYVKRPDGSYSPASSARSHYITATGIDEEWLRISSWGREYYIRRSEYDAYVKKHSTSIVSNVLMLRRIP